MKKMAFLLWIATTIICSCSSPVEKGRFRLTGNLKNAADQKIYLEQLYFSQKNPEILDTAEIKNGKFELSAVSQEEGLYRIRLEKQEMGFVFINDQPKISFTADTKDSTLDGPVFYSPANEKFKSLLKQISARGTSIQACAKTIDSLDKLGTADSLAALEKDRFVKLDAEFKKFIVKFIDSTSDPVIAMFALGYTRNIDPAELKSLVPALAKRFPDHQGLASLVLEYNQAMTEQAQPQRPANGNAQVGSVAPELTMDDTDGKPYSLSKLKGKYVLVDFWASWCGPCRGENPNIVAAYNKFKDKNFTILGVSLDEDKAKWLAAIKDDGLTWKQVSDLKGWSSAAASIFGFEAIPYNVLLDPEGKIIATSLRGSALEAKLAEVLK